MWKVDSLAYINPDIVEVIYEIARRCDDLNAFRKRFCPNLREYRQKTLLLCEYNHPFYGPMFSTKILIDNEKLANLLGRDPLINICELVPSGLEEKKELLAKKGLEGLESTLKGLILKYVTDPYQIFILLDGKTSTSSRLEDILNFC